MMQLVPEDTIRSALLSLIDIRRTNLGCEVQLPLFYPDGGSVTVTVVAERGDYLVHDSGSGTMFLSANGITLTKKLSQRIHDLAAMYGCDFSSGRVERRCTPEDIGVCAAIVANASRSVGDQLLQRPVLPALDFRKEVLEKVREVVGAKRYRENEEVLGASGYSYQVSAVVLDASAAGPISYVEPVRDHDTATKKFREFWDISRSEEFGSIRRIALFDDKRNWDSSDLIILQEVSNLVRVSDAAQRMAQLIRSD
jgi:hypothetical protein